jgi:hypothetical protein
MIVLFFSIGMALSVMVGYSAAALHDFKQPKAGKLLVALWFLFVVVGTACL